MTSTEDFDEEVHKANVRYHKAEAKYYEMLHGEIYGSAEQKRINSMLEKIDKLIINNNRRALDFGAGTGNITGKLLRMGYSVLAVDISPEMVKTLEIKFKDDLENKKLRVITSEIESINLEEGEFDLITSYSVLHHLPNYEKVIHELSTLLKKGGVMYLDHEDLYYPKKQSSIDRLIQFIHFRSDRLIDHLFFRSKGITVPPLNISAHDRDFTDYWDRKNRHLDSEKIESVFESENFGFYTQINYHVNSSWIFSPTYCLFKHISKPNYVCWVARK